MPIIQTIKTYPYTTGTLGTPTSTVTYSYEDEEWGDLLTKYNGQTITYDNIGNPLTWRDGMAMTWMDGRRLSSLQTNGKNIQYTYDADGLRVTKTVDGTKHTYQYVGGQLRYETRGNISFSYEYDAYGNLSCIHYIQANGTSVTYYVVCNSRGDVTAIYNAAGTLQAKYSYDSWGNTLSITDVNGNAITSTTHIGNLNMIRYRGYYYDSETGFYYLQNRYYDPQVKRFISPDSASTLTATPASLNDKNLFAYCDNNPVNRVDVGGQFWDTVFDVVSLAVSVIDVIANPDDPWAWIGLAGDVVDLIPFVTCVGEVTRVVSTTKKVVEAADTVHDAAKTIDNVGDTVETIGDVGKTASNAKDLHRPYIRKSTRQAVEAKALRSADGKFLDANMKTVIEGKYDFGHVAGHEFWREKQMAMSKGWSQKQFNNYMNNPDFYQIEDPHWNRSHLFEQKYDVLGKKGFAYGENNR